MLEDFTWLDGIGVVGSLVICTAYWQVTRQRLHPEGAVYNLMNLGGAGLLLVSLYFRPNPGAILIEVIWAAIALVALTRLLRSER